MKSRCCRKNVPCPPFVAFWCKEKKFSSSFGRWTDFDDPRPVADRRHNARRCTLGCDSTAAEKWSTASTCVSSLACRCNKVDIRTQAHVRCSVHVDLRPALASTWRRPVISQAWKRLCLACWPRPHSNVWRRYLLYGRNHRTCLNRPEFASSLIFS